MQAGHPDPTGNLEGLLQLRVYPVSRATAPAGHGMKSAPGSENPRHFRLVLWAWGTSRGRTLKVSAEILKFWSWSPNCEFVMRPGKGAFAHVVMVESSSWIMGGPVPSWILES